jgi:hypothetical protein
MSDRPPPLTPGARAIVDAARGDDEPGAGDRERVRAKVLAALAAGGAAGAGAAGKASAATSATAGGALATKLAVIAVAVAGLATGAYLAMRSPSTTTTPPPSQSEVSALPPEPQPEPEVVPEVTADASIEMAPEDVPDPAPKPRAKRKVEAPALSPADSLREERALIARASDALRDGDGAAALAAVKEHQRRFPDGLLIEERSAARVQALCALGRTADGTSAREAFLARWPRSVHAAKVRAACAP